MTEYILNIRYNAGSGGGWFERMVVSLDGFGEKKIGRGSAVLKTEDLDDPAYLERLISVIKETPGVEAQVEVTPPFKILGSKSS